MAEENEIIISIQLDQEGAASEMEKVRKSIEDLTAEKRKLQQAYKEGTITQDEYIEGAIRIEGTLKEAKKQYADLTKEQETNNNSINALRLSNKRLLEERNNLDLSTQQGRDRLKEINQQLDDNNAKIKANVSGYEKQKIGIGDYTGALAKFFPFLAPISEGMDAVKEGMDSAGEGAEGANKSLLKLVLNPIGITLMAIVGALTLLYKAFSSTQAGADALEDIMASVSAVLSVLMDRVGKVANALFSFFTGDMKGAAEGFSGAVSGVGEEMSKASKEARELAAATRDLEDATMMYNLEAAKTENSIQRLLIQAKNRNLSEQQRIALLNQATQKEKESVDTQIKLADTGINIASRQLAQRLNLVKQASESEVAFGERVLKAYMASNGAQVDNLRDNLIKSLEEREKAESKSLSFQEKIQNQKDALADKVAEAEAKRIEKEKEAEAKRIEKSAAAAQRAREAREKEAEEFAKRNEFYAEAQETADQDMAEFFEKLDEQQIKQTDAALTAALDQIETDKQTKAILEQQEEEFQQKIREEIAQTAADEKAQAKAVKDAKLKAANEALAGLQSIAAEGTIVNKAAALAQIAIDTGEAISGLTAASEQNPANAVTFGGAGVIQFAAGLVRILGNVAQAKKIIGFDQGGLSGTRVNESHGIPISRSNGDNILATVRTGEVILNERQQAALGGANTFRRIGVPGFASGGVTGMDTLNASRMTKTSIQMDELLNSVSQQRPVLVLEEFEFASSRKSSADKNAVIV